MIPEKTIKDRWASFDSKRTSKLQKARIHASVTIPTLLPLQSTSQEQYIPNQHSSVQSRGVTSLASKILSVLIPLNDTPFFTFGLKSGKEPSAEIASYLATLSVQVFKKLSSNNLREIAYLAIQHLIVLGDVLIISKTSFIGLKITDLIIPYSFFNLDTNICSFIFLESIYSIKLF